MARPFAKVRGVFERPKGSGIWWVRYADQYGRIHREKIGPRSLAIEVYAKRKAEVKEGIYFPKKRKRHVLLKEIAEDFLSYSRSHKRSSKDDERYMQYWSGCFKQREAETITTEDIEKAKQELAQGRTVATVNRYLAALKTAYYLAMKKGKVSRNPVRGVKFDQENNARIRYLDADEERRLMAALPSHHKPLVALALNTGLRRGELLGLSWEDVDLRTGSLTVRRSKHGETRYVPLNQIAIQTLLDIKKNRKVLAAFVFTTEDGHPFYWLDNAFKKALKRAGIENFRFHDLRHTFASRLAMRGVPLRTIQELLGHKTMTMTLRYAHLSPGHLREAVEGLCGIINEGQTGTSTGTKPPWTSENTHQEEAQTIDILAEREGFEPPERLPAQLISSQSP